MNATGFKNIHAKAREVSPTPKLPRLRAVTNDPAREFAQRPGRTRPLPHNIAALILHRQEFRLVGRDGITIDGRQFWSEHSITIATKSGTREKVLITYNRHDPSVIHVLTRDGAYVESIPEKGLAPMFDPVATQRELGAHRRAQQRDMDRMAAIHGADSLAELARAKSNAAQMRRVVSTFDVPQGTEKRSAPVFAEPVAATSPSPETSDSLRLTLRAQPRSTANHFPERSATVFAEPVAAASPTPENSDALRLALHAQPRSVVSNSDLADSIAQAEDHARTARTKRKKIRAVDVIRVAMKQQPEEHAEGANGYY